jgi:hypothetical protein
VLGRACRALLPGRLLGLLLLCLVSVPRGLGALLGELLRLLVKLLRLGLVGLAFLILRVHVLGHCPLLGDLLLRECWPRVLDVALELRPQLARDQREDVLGLRRLGRDARGRFARLLTNAPSKDFLDWMCTHIISDKVLILLGFWDGVDSS